MWDVGFQLPVSALLQSAAPKLQHDSLCASLFMHRLTSRLDSYTHELQTLHHQPLLPRSRFHQVTPQLLKRGAHVPLPFEADPAQRVKAEQLSALGM